MAVWIAMTIAAAQIGTPPPALPMSHAPGIRVSVSARATVRILSAAKVRLGSGAQPDGHKLNATEVTLEDGRRHPAKLVEFQ